MSRVFSKYFSKGSKLQFICAPTNPNNAAVIFLTASRSYRKPRWVPMAKSKMFKNKELNVYFKEEDEEKSQLVENHRIYTKSLWSWQKQVMSREASNTGAELYSEDVELRRIIWENEEANVRVKSRREKELVEEWVQVAKEISRQKLEKEGESVQKFELAKEKVLSEMEKLKNSINLEDLDDAIERALSSEVDYNFAIDKSGNVISGISNGGPLIYR